MDIGTEINVTSCIVSMTGQALGYSFFRALARGEILRADFDITHED
jgi:hypothetical protein